MKTNFLLGLVTFATSKRQGFLGKDDGNGFFAFKNMGREFRRLMEGTADQTEEVEGGLHQPTTLALTEASAMQQMEGADELG